jgi:hypothetical protein
MLIYGKPMARLKTIGREFLTGLSSLTDLSSEANEKVYRSRIGAELRAISTIIVEEILHQLPSDSDKGYRDDVDDGEPVPSCWWASLVRS